MYELVNIEVFLHNETIAITSWFVINLISFFFFNLTRTDDGSDEDIVTGGAECYHMF